jgi:hypothetical protein
MQLHGRDMPFDVTSNAVGADPVLQGFRVHVELPRQPRDHRLGIDSRYSRTARSRSSTGISSSLPLETPFHQACKIKPWSASLRESGGSTSLVITSSQNRDAETTCPKPT